MSISEDRKKLLSETLRLEYEHQMFKLGLDATPLDFERMAEMVTVADKSAFAAEGVAGEIRGLQWAQKTSEERSRDYARSANEHAGTELGEVYTDKCGVCASIATRIYSRIAVLTKGLR